MTSRFLICLLALALFAAGTVSGSRSALAASIVAADATAILSAADGAHGPSAAMAAKPCKRGVLAANACGSDHGLLVRTGGDGGRPGKADFDVSSPPMAGVPPACVIGPPRSC
jgi:hypothetical protein